LKNFVYCAIVEMSDKISN